MERQETEERGEGHATKGSPIRDQEHHSYMVCIFWFLSTRMSPKTLQSTEWKWKGSWSASFHLPVFYVFWILWMETPKPGFFLRRELWRHQIWSLLQLLTKLWCRLWGKHCFLTSVCGFRSFVIAVAALRWCVVISTENRERSHQNFQRGKETCVK